MYGESHGILLFIVFYCSAIEKNIYINMTGKGRFKAKECAEFEVVKTNDVNNKNEKHVIQQCKQL